MSQSTSGRVQTGGDIDSKLISRWTLHKFFRNVAYEQRGCHDGNGEPSACWIWMKAVCDRGYGRVKIGGFRGKTYKAHRLAYVLFTNDYDIGGCDIHHLCGVRNCVNPLHLEKRKSWDHRAGTDGNLLF